MADTDPAATLRRAAELAPTVLPPEIVALVAQKITLALDSPMRIANLHPFYGRLAAEVLALAEQQQARGDVYVYRNTTESLLTPTTKEVAPGVCVDGNDDGLVGVEVLDAVLVEIDGHPVVDGRVAATVLPPPPEVDTETAPADERPGALRILVGDHLFVKLAQPASEPWHLVYCPRDQRLSGWQSDEDMVDAVPAGRIPVELAVPEPSGDVVEAVAREICNVGRDYDLWASDEVGESTREDLRAEARAAIVAMQQPGGLNPAVQDVRLTPEELAALEARFTAQRGRSTLIGVSKQMVTRAQVRDAAHALFLWNNELAGDPRFTLHHVAGAVDREPYGALVDEVLHHLGIPVQEGEQP